MRCPLLAAVSVVALASLAHGQVSLDWSSSSWSNGSTTGLYNALRGPGSATAVIPTLTYNFGDGLLATVSASRTGVATWQNSTSVFGGNGWAPRVTNAGFFAFGINNGSVTTGGTLTLTFNHDVELNSFTIGDLDSGGSVKDHVLVGLDDGALSIISQASVAPTHSYIGETLSLVGTSGNETNFTSSAPTSWLTIGSGDTSFRTLTISLENGNGSHGIWFGDLDITAVPEPSTYGLVGAAALLALVGYRRSRKS